MQTELNSRTVEELREWFSSNHWPAFRGSQLFTHFHKHMQPEIDGVRGFSAPFLHEVKQAESYVSVAIISDRRVSDTGDSVKYALRLRDGQIIEAVFMRYAKHNTLCISTQVGCAMGCAFCASTKSGLYRNLTAGEMLSQYYAIVRDTREPIQNLVLMGIGEPFENYEEVVRALEILHHPHGRNMSYRNMTISTCGVVPGILRLSEENMPVNLAVSLHAATDEQRTKIMPIAKKYPLEELMKACDTYFARTGRRISFEYTVIPGVNDSREDIVNLHTLLKGKGAHVNLISYHPIREYGHERPKEQEIHRFAAQLENQRIHATVRRSVGLESEGACGQLRAQGQRRNSQEVQNGNSNKNGHR